MKKFNFKGQAALEFMMTYGWAILVVLAAIGALSYFGILNPSKFTPDTCLASSGFACPGKPILDADSVTFSIVNGLGYNIDLNTNFTTKASISATGPFATCTDVYICDQGNITCTEDDKSLEDGGGATVRAEGCGTPFANIQVAKGEFKLVYENPQSKLDETIIISVTGKPVK